MRGSSYSQKTLSVSGSSRMRVQSPSPSRCRGSSYGRGRAGVQSQAVEVATEIHQHHANEKEEMQELNVRFAGYIEKVQTLEQRNAALRAELESLQGRFKGGPAGLGEEYEQKFKEMKDLIEALTAEKGAADIERGYIEEEVEVWRLKLEEELALKGETLNKVSFKEQNKIFNDVDKFQRRPKSSCASSVRTSTTPPSRRPTWRNASSSSWPRSSS